MVASVTSCSDNLTPLRWTSRRCSADPAGAERRAPGSRPNAQATGRGPIPKAPSQPDRAIGGARGAAARVVERRRLRRVRARRDPVDASTSRARRRAASSSSSRAVKQVVQRSNCALVAVGVAHRGDARGAHRSPGRTPRPSSRWRSANAAENARHRERARPARSAAAIRPNTAGSSRPPSRPKPPWHRQIAASNSPSYARSRTSSYLERRASSPSPAAASRARRDELGRRGRRRRRRCPRRPSASECRPGPHPTSSTRIPGSSPSASTRKSTSCSVPLVNALRRYAGPRNSATASNQYGPPRRHAAA